MQEFQTRLTRTFKFGGIKMDQEIGFTISPNTIARIRQKAANVSKEASGLAGSVAKVMTAAEDLLQTVADEAKPNPEMNSDTSPIIAQPVHMND